MSIRDWSKLLTAGILYLLILLWIGQAGVGVFSDYVSNSRTYQEYQQRTYTNQRQAADKIASNCAVANAPASIVAQCLSEQLTTYNKGQTADKDLQAQQDVAFWAFWTFIVAAVNVPVGLGGMALVWRSLRHTREAITIDREVGHAQVRAYLTVEPGEPGDVTIDKPFTAAFTIKNTGQSPAYGMYYLAAVTEAPYSLPEQGMPTVDGEPTKPSITLVAGEGTLGEAEAERLLTLQQINSVMGGGDTRLYLIGIVHYRDVFKQEHLTRFCFYLDSKAAGKPDPRPGQPRVYNWYVSPTNNEAN
jgi:hypothetical protein